MSRPHGNQPNFGKGEVSRSRDHERRARPRSRSRSISFSDSSSNSPSRKRRAESKHSRGGHRTSSSSRQGNKLGDRDRRERSPSSSSDSSPNRRPAADRKSPAKRSTAPEPAAPSFAMRKPVAVSIGRIGGAASKIVPVQMKLGANKPAEAARKLTVASAFCNDSDDSDDEAEEMPAECRMRMRNIGRDTPTSSGPNSFGKTKHGFCDSQKMVEKTLKTQNTAKK